VVGAAAPVVCPLGVVVSVRAAVTEVKRILKASERVAVWHEADHGLTPYQTAEVGESPDLAVLTRLHEHGGRWSFPHEKFDPDRYNPARGRHSWGIRPTDAPATFAGDGGRTVYYDPARTQVSQGEFRPEVSAHGNRVRDLQDRQPGTIWRGMSHEEYEQARARGYFQSAGGYNLGGQENATLFSDDPDTAGSYASGYSPYQHMPTFSRPAHVIGIPDSPDYPRPHLDDEVEVPGRIPFDAVTHHYRGDVIAIQPGSYGGYQDSPDPEYGYNGFREPPARSKSPSVSVQWSADHPGRGHTAELERGRRWDRARMLASFSPDVGVDL